MSLLALTLVLTSAVLHATWNLLAKRSNGGAVFTWLFAALTSIIYAPVAATFYLITRPTLTLAHLGITAVSAAIHVAYFLSLQRGYRAGDLSLVYPLARGTGPLLATVAAILFLGERPTYLALTGTALVVFSVFMLAGGFDALSSGRNRSATLYGLLTGLFIACYTVWDGYAVSVALIPPLLFFWLSEVIRTLFLLPVALKNPAEVRREWREHKREALGIALLSPLAYVLVLTALVFTPVSYVAPTREVSILIGTLFGARLLAEEDGARRLVAASGMVLGVALLALN